MTVVDKVNVSLAWKTLGTVYSRVAWYVTELIEGQSKGRMQNDAVSSVLFDRTLSQFLHCPISNVINGRVNGFTVRKWTLQCHCFSSQVTWGKVSLKKNSFLTYLYLWGYHCPHAVDVQLCLLSHCHLLCNTLCVFPYSSKGQHWTSYP